MDVHEKMFVAYSRKLLRSLEHIREKIDEGDLKSDKELLNGVIEDTKTDIEVALK